MQRAFLSGGILAAFLLVTAISAARAEDAEDLRGKQQTQQQARLLAGELVSGILDIQIRQLEENGLTELPVYGEIRAMRANIGRLVDEEMEQVVLTLTRAQELPADQRLALLQTARDQIREIVVQLMAERQKLLRRLRLERLAAQVRQLIALQTETLAATRSLPERTPDEREAALLAAVQDQRDARSLFLALVDALADVATWGGTIGAGAVDGLGIVKAGQVGASLDQAGQRLEAGEFAESAAAQTAVIRGLRALLARLEQTQGLTTSDRETALTMVRELLERQQQLRADVGQAESLEGSRAEPLIERQAEVRKDLGELAEALAPFPAAQPPLEQAKSSSYEAAARLFAADQPGALAEQDRVVGSLAEIAQRLEQAIELDRQDRSAEELAEMLRRLETLAQGLERAAEAQQPVVAAAADAAAQARAEEQSVADTLRAAADAAEPGEQPLPPIVASRLNNAQAEVSEAVAALADATPAAAPRRQEQARRAERAIRQALAETRAQIADMQRRQMAVEVGELARAAETLERAAASERAVAAAAAAAQEQGFSGEQAAALAGEQSRVAEAADSIARGVRGAVPAAATALDRAAPRIDQAAGAIRDAGQRPGEASRAEAPVIAQAARAAAEELTAAAAALRSHAAVTARGLAGVAQEQLGQLASIQQPLEKSLGQPAAQAEAPATAADSLARLEQALDLVEDARVGQLRAEGRAAAAEAAAWSRDVRRVGSAQSSADRAAEEVRAGRANTPLEAVVQQHAVAEKLAELGERAEGPLGEHLQAASRASAEAARELLHGDPQRAESARQSAVEALTEAAAAAEQAARDAAVQPPEALDAASQRRVAVGAGEAEQLATAAAPEAAGELANARQSAEQAAQAIEAGQESAARDGQQQTAASLESAATRLREAIDRRAAEALQRTADRAAQAAPLAEQAESISPEAASALEAAASAGRRAAEAAPLPPAAVNAAAAQVQQSMERAAAGLAERQQLIQRDRELALAMARWMEQQQQAREAIARQARAVTQSPAAGEADPEAATDPSEFTGSERAAAAALERATQEFAGAQRAVGEAAAEIAGQSEVASQPIRQGLEAASGLNEEGLGTGLVPATPDVTAAQIAGAEAMQRAAEVMAAAPPLGGADSESDGADPLQGSPSQPPSPAGPTGPPLQPSSASSPALASGVAQGQQSASESAATPGEMPTSPEAQGDSRTADSDHDAAVRLRELTESPWFARLPPALRAAIQSQARRPPPRGYEERLRSYFGSP